MKVLDLDIESLQAEDAEAAGGNGTMYQTPWSLPGGDYRSSEGLWVLVQPATE